MIETFDIAVYTRISVDEEMDRDNTSIENPKANIKDFIRQKFPDSTLTFCEDRDRSGYTFEQREGYQAMRRELTGHRRDILIVKDFSRFSHRSSRGLVALEDLRDAETGEILLEQKFEDMPHLRRCYDVTPDTVRLRETANGGFEPVDPAALPTDGTIFCRLYERGGEINRMFPAA